MSREDVIGLIKKYLHQLEKNGIPVYKAYLYGSYARNDAKEESDIDVMIISDLFDDCDDTVLAKPWSLNLRVDHRIEPYIVGKKRFFTDDISPILEIVRREGIEITL